MHGGIAATLLDSVMGCCIHTTLKAGIGYTTVEIKVNYVRAMTDKTGPVRAEGKVINVGSRIATSEGRLVRRRRQAAGARHHDLPDLPDVTARREEVDALPSRHAADAAAEQRILRLSIGVTVVVSLFGVVFGLLSGSLSIVFDGVFAAIDAAMSGLALFVSRLVSRESDNRRFQFGYWHIEPMVLAFNGGTLMLLCFYAFLNAVDSFLAGGRQLDFDWAIAYAVIGLHRLLRHVLLRAPAPTGSIGSDFVRLDAQSWLMSAAITSALLVAFAIAWSLKGTRFGDLTPYADPIVLALLTLCLVFVPIRTVRKALQEILLITPPELDAHVRERHGCRRRPPRLQDLHQLCRQGRTRPVHRDPYRRSGRHAARRHCRRRRDPSRDRRGDRRRGPAALAHHRLHRRSEVALVGSCLI